LSRYLLFLGLLVLLAWRSSGLVAQDNARVQALLDEADKLTASQSLDAALSRIQEALRIAPSSLNAMQRQINLYFLMKNDKEALRCADEAIDKHPNTADLYYLRGVINNSRGKYGKALEDFEVGISLKPEANEYKFYLGRGVSHMNLTEYDQALADFSAAISRNDTVASAYYSRAMANYEIKEYDSAVTDFLKALDINGGNAALYFNLGMSYYRLNEKDRACPYFHKACTMGNTNACRMALMECAKALPTVP
jgi:tetratricopeptide (TPR) repeat protein